MQYLLSIPPAALTSIPALEQLAPPDWYLNADPAGKRLGSGGD